MNLNRREFSLTALGAVGALAFSPTWAPRAVERKTSTEFAIEPPRITRLSQSPPNHAEPSDVGCRLRLP